MDNIQTTDKKTTIIGVVIGIAILAVLVWLVGGFSPKTPGIGDGEGGQSTDVFRPDNIKALPTVEGGTRETIEQKIETPGVGAEVKNPDIAVPISAVQTGPSSLRNFNLSVQDNKYIPSTIVVNEGDVIDISLTAVDADYDFFLPDFGIYKKVNKGETGKLQFQAYPFGKYVFYCKNCAKEVKGTLIVNSR